MNNKRRIVPRTHIAQGERHSIQHAIKQRCIAVGERRGAGLNVNGPEKAGQVVSGKLSRGPKRRLHVGHHEGGSNPLSGGIPHQHRYLAIAPTCEVVAVAAQSSHLPATRAVIHLAIVRGWAPHETLLDGTGLKPVMTHIHHHIVGHHRSTSTLMSISGRQIRHGTWNF